MARIVDCRTRNEKTIGEGHAFIGNKVLWVPSPDTPGHLQAAGEVLTIGVGNTRLELSETEALHVMGEMLKEISLRRCREEMKREKA